MQNENRLTSVVNGETGLDVLELLAGEKVQLQAKSKKETLYHECCTQKPIDISNG